MDSLTPEEIAQILMQALLNGDQALMRALAKQAVQRFAGMEPGRPVGGTYYLYRTLRNLDLDGMLDKLMEASRQQVGGELTNLEQRLERDPHVVGDHARAFCRRVNAVALVEVGPIMKIHGMARALKNLLGPRH